MQVAGRHPRFASQLVEGLGLKAVSLAADHQHAVVGDTEFAGTGEGVVVVGLDPGELVLEFTKGDGRIADSSNHESFPCSGPGIPGPLDS